MTLANVEVGTLQELEILQQQLLKHQQALQLKAFLINQQLAKHQQQHQQITRSQSMQYTPTTLAQQSYTRQPSLPSINDLCYNSKPISNQNVSPSLHIAPLPTPPCISLQRRDSVKSDGSQSSSDTAAGRYKTELCRPFEETGHCRYGSKCQFAHGSQELRSLNRHPRYKTEFCRTFHTTGFCSYGQRCNFIHNEEERRSPQQSTSGRPQALSLNGHPTLKHTSSIGSTGSSPASSVYGDASPVHSPSYLSEDSLSLRLSPTPSFSSDTSFPSPISPSTDELDAGFLASPLDFGLNLSLLSKLSL